MNANLLTGALVRLSVDEPKEQAKSFFNSSRDSEFRRLLNSSAAGLYSLKQMEKWVEDEEAKEQNNAFNFGIRILADDRLAGSIGLFVNDWSRPRSLCGHWPGRAPRLGQRLWL